MTHIALLLCFSSTTCSRGQRGRSERFRQQNEAFRRLHTTIPRQQLLGDSYHLCHHPSTRTMMSSLWIPRTASAVRALTALRRPTTTTMLHLRYYRGQAGEAPPVLSEKEESLIKVAKPKSDEILAKHHRLPNVAEIPPASLDPTQDNLDIRRKRLIYRSKQRGWLEVDLLLGTWAHENVHLLTEAELDEYEAFVNFETIEYVPSMIFKISLEIIITDTFLLLM